MVGATPLPLQHQERYPVPIVLEAGWSPELKRCTYTPSSTSAPEEVGDQCNAPASLLPRERSGTHFVGGGMGPGLKRCTNSFSLTSAPEEVGGHATPRPLYFRERDPVAIVLEAGWAQGLKMCTYTPVTSALERVGVQCHAPAALLPRRRRDAHCIGGLMGPGLKSCTYTPSLTSTPGEVAG